MNHNRIKRISHRLSWALRHGARELGLDMDAAGWVFLSELLPKLQVAEAAVMEVVEHNNKSRFEVGDGRIRASQGHSRDGMPVTLEALEDSWALHHGDDSVWHGTNLTALDGIASDGIHAGRRTHVHLAAVLDSHVGKRANVAVMLEVSVERLRGEGLEVFVSPNGVVLARRVPTPCIVGLCALTRAARSQEQRLRARFQPVRSP